MSTRVVLAVGALAVCLLAAATPAAAQAPAEGQAPAPPANEDCLACHDDSSATRAYGSSIAVAVDAVAKSVHGPLTCVSCHADLAKTTEWPHPEKLQPATCSTCHDSEGRNYEDSVHGLAVSRSGLAVAPRCGTCHGTHDIQRPSNPESKVHRAQIAGTCTTCHEGIAPLYATSVHAQPLGPNQSAAAVCSDCHTAHRIQRSDADAWRLSVIAECGTCHLERVSSYRDNFHGQKTTLGSTRTATCSSCHDYHGVLPASNPASTIAPQNLVATCRSCHPQASESFVKYDPHADKNDSTRSAPVYWTYRSMQGLLLGVFAFFGVHTLLWFPRSYRARQERRAAAAAREDSAS
ncbi:MAG: cytochrome c3 family protein [Acidobacteriota bacterium]|nr:cytochrome c3 family protein [Acidobacteriota bacterium]